MNITRKICCFCFIPLEPQKFIRTATIIMLTTAILGLLLEIFPFFHLGGGFYHVLRPIIIILCIMIIIFSSYILVKLKKNLFNRLRCFGITMIISNFVFLLKMFIFAVMFFITISRSEHHQEESHHSRKRGVGMFVGVLVLGLMHVFYAWLVHMSFGIIKMHRIVEQQESEKIQQMTIQGHRERDVYSQEHENNISRENNESNDYQQFDDVEQGNLGHQIRNV